jgi:type IV pilus assembly protein PilQ
MWTTKKLRSLALLLTVMASFFISLPRIAHAVPEAGNKSESKLAAIDSIAVSGEDDAAELVIKLSSPTTYTSYKTTAPLRLVVDLSQATQGTITAPLVINKGNFKTVTVSRYDTDAGVLTRLDIELVKDSEAIVSATPDQKGELRVSFPALIPQAATVAVPVEAPAELITPEVPAAEEPLNVAVNPIATQVRSLTAVLAKNDSIVLAIKGGAGEFKSFRLNNPERFVIDLFNVKSVLADRIVPVNAAGVASARLGLYPDKIRVVLDAVNGTFPEAVVSKSHEGVTVALNSKEIVENPNTRLVSARTEPAVESEKHAVAKLSDSSSTIAPEKAPVVEQPIIKPAAKVIVRPIGPATVEMIDFQVIEGISRVAVKVAGNITAEAPVKTPGFVTLTIKNTNLPKRLQRSLDAQSFVSPVLRITPILVKTHKRTDTKIRIALRTIVPYEFKQEGDMFYVDFKNPEGLTTDKTPAELKEARTPIAQSAKASLAKNADIYSELAPVTDVDVKSVDTSKMYKGRKVTLEFADAEVRKIFQLLSEVSNKNFVLGDDVSGTISIKLVNVPWDQALDIILDTKGLDKREDGNIIIIKGKGKFKSQAEEELEIKKQQFKSIELKTEMFSINYADIGGIVGQFTALKSDRGTIAQDVRTNKVIVKDIPQAIEDMRRLLQQLDVPEKQVMIEARIVEATSTFTRSLGVNWGIHYRDGSASILGINQLDTGFGGLTTAPPTTGTGINPGGAMGISFGTLTSNIQLDMRLNAAASAGLIKIVSTPKVATINNKTAKITQGQQIPYTSSTSDKTETKFIEAALALEVTPHINANGTIVLKIDAKNDSPGAVPFGAAAPSINKKQATTEMLLRDGETTVIGGIYIDNDTESDDGVPFLMDIPLLGTLFKTNSKTKTKTELLIFITPRILSLL